MTLLNRAGRAQVCRSVGEPTLQTYAAFLRRWRVLLLFAVVTGLLAGGVLHYSKPLRYTSTAHLVILASTVTRHGEDTSNISIDSALQLLRSNDVLGPVAQGVHYPGGASALNENLTTRPIVNSRIVRLSVSASDPKLAFSATQAVTDRFLDIRRSQLEAADTMRRKSVNSELIAVETELDELYGLSDAMQLQADELGGGEDGQRRAESRIGPLVTLRAELHGDLAALSISQPNPGYLSRPPTQPVRGQRSGLAITMSSAITLSLLVALALGAFLELHGGGMRQMTPTAPVEGDPDE